MPKPTIFDEIERLFRDSEEPTLQALRYVTRKYSDDEEFWRSEVRASDTIMSADLSGLSKPVLWGKPK